MRMLRHANPPYAPKQVRASARRRGRACGAQRAVARPSGDAHHVGALLHEELAQRHLREAVGRVLDAALLRDVHVALVDVEAREVPAAVNVASPRRRRAVLRKQPRRARVAEHVRGGGEDMAQLLEKLAN